MIHVFKMFTRITTLTVRVVSFSDESKVHPGAQIQALQ